MDDQPTHSFTSTEGYIRRDNCLDCQWESLPSVPSNHTAPLFTRYSDFATLLYNPGSEHQETCRPPSSSRSLEPPARRVSSCLDLVHTGCAPLYRFADDFPLAPLLPQAARSYATSSSTPPSSASGPSRATPTRPPPRPLPTRASRSSRVMPGTRRRASARVRTLGVFMV